jgi:hypothetical protein
MLNRSSRLVIFAVLASTVASVGAVMADEAPGSADPIAGVEAPIAMSDARAHGVHVHFSRGAGKRARFDVYDTGCDNHQVYVVWKINNGRTQRKNYNGGCNSKMSFYLRGGSFNIQYRACVDVQLGKDLCSGWVHDHN